MPLPANGDAAGESSNNPSAWYQNLNPQWGGHLKTRGAASWYDEQTIYETVGHSPYVDGSAEGRLKNLLFFGEWGQFETHYEVILYGGDNNTEYGGFQIPGTPFINKAPNSVYLWLTYCF